MDDIPEPFSSVLITIAKYLHDSKHGGQFYERDIRALHPYNINLAVMRAGLNWLVEKEYLIQRWEQHSPESEKVRFFEFSASAAIYMYEKSRENTASEYEPLALDRQSPVLDEALALTEELAEKVRGNNGIETELRLSLANSLHFGVALLRASLPTKAQIEATIMAPLRLLAAKFALAEIGEIAKRATDLFKQLF